MSSGWIHFLSERAPEIWLRLGEHILLAGISTICATAIAVPLGVAARRHQRLRAWVTSVTGVFQTVPSLAMLALFVACFDQFGAPPALMALTLYALLPIVRNTLTGLENVPASVVEAADSLGMTPMQKLGWVEIPVAAPVIVAGIRTAAVVGVGIATLSAFIGAGGLGVFINRGLSLRNVPLILLGVVLSALLAVLVDFMIAAMQWACDQRKTRSLSLGWSRLVRAFAFGAPACLLVLGILAKNGAAFSSDRLESTETIRIGSKNFAEQLILGELMAQLLEQHTDMQVVRKFDLGGTMICHGALVSGGIDLYPEYTGTALTAVLGDAVIADPADTLDHVAAEYAEQFGLRWLAPFGFNNTYALTVREKDAQALGLKCISDLKPLALRWKAGWTFEFSERPDGYPGLSERYGLEFGQVTDLESSMMYEALARNEVDVISAFSTDGRIDEYDLKILEDDLGFFPSYLAAPVIRADLLERHPEVGTVLQRLGEQITTDDMRRLNLQVAQHDRSPREVARAFLDQRPTISADLP